MIGHIINHNSRRKVPGTFLLLHSSGYSFLLPAFPFCRAPGLPYGRMESLSFFSCSLEGRII